MLHVKLIQELRKEAKRKPNFSDLRDYSLAELWGYLSDKGRT